jgi:hypothetical protein
VVVTANGDATAPFEGRRKLENGGGVAVSFDYIPGPSLCSGALSSVDYDYDDREALIIEPFEDSKLHAHGSRVYAPKTAKLIQVDKYTDADNYDRKSVRLGSFDDVTRAFFDNTSGLAITKRAGSYVIHGDRTTPKYASHTDALLALVQDYGFREAIADQLLAQAGDTAVETRYKTAAVFDLKATTPNAPPTPETQRNAGTSSKTTYEEQPSQEHWSRVDEMDSRNNPRDASADELDPDTGLTSNETQTILDTLQTGSKELFDIGSIGSLLRNTSQEGLVDEYLPELITAQDRICRIRINFYAHAEQLADQYGKAEIPELEDKLQNAQEALSEAILDLKKKTAKPSMDMEVDGVRAVMN